MYLIGYLIFLGFFPLWCTWINGLEGMPHSKLEVLFNYWYSFFFLIYTHAYLLHEHFLKKFANFSFSSLIQSYTNVVLIRVKMFFLFIQCTFSLAKGIHLFINIKIKVKQSTKLKDLRGLVDKKQKLKLDKTNSYYHI